MHLAVIAGAIGLGAVAALLLYVPGRRDRRLGAARGRPTALVALGIAAVVRPGLARGRGGRRPRRRRGLALLAAISLGLLNTPLDDGRPGRREAERGEDPTRSTRPPQHPGLTRELYEGLRWVREHSGEDDRIAVNNDTPLYFYYSAFSERRAFLEAWLYSIDAQRIGYRRVARGEEIPFPELRELNAAVFDAARPDAVREMRDEYGVDFLLVDKAHGTGLTRGGRPRRSGVRERAPCSSIDVRLQAAGRPASRNSG